MALTVLVAGATGRFGHICDALLARGHNVRAVTRDPTSSAAQRLAGMGAEVVVGDFDDPAGMKALMGEIDSVFATGTMHQAGLASELRHSRNLIDAVAGAGVGHLVWVSGAGATPGTGVPLLDVKAEVERHLQRRGVVQTVVAPVYLMENLFNPWNLPALREDKVPSFISARQRLQQVPTIDVVAFAVLALEQRDRFAGQRVEIASDDPTAEQLARILTGIVGRPFVVDQRLPGELGADLELLYAWLEADGQTVDIGEMRRLYPEVGWHTFEQWALQLAAL